MATGKPAELVAGGVPSRLKTIFSDRRGLVIAPDVGVAAGNGRRRTRDGLLEQANLRERRFQARTGDADAHLLVVTGAFNRISR